MELIIFELFLLLLVFNSSCEGNFSNWGAFHVFGMIPFSKVLAMKQLDENGAIESIKAGIKRVQGEVIPGLLEWPPITNNCVKF